MIYLSFEQESPRPWYHVRHDDFYDRFAYYGTGGLYDPKNYTIEPWLLGGGTVGVTRGAWSRPTLYGFGRGFLLSQGFAFLGVGLIGAIFDPLDHNEGGLDEYIGSLHDTKENIESGLSWWDRQWQNAPDFLRN